MTLLSLTSTWSVTLFSQFLGIINWSLAHSLNGGKRVPKGVGFSPVETRFRYLRPNEVGFGQINREEMPFLQERTYNKLKRYKINTGEFAVSIVGTLGKIALVNLDGLEVEDDCLILSENFAKLSPLVKINRQFYYYFFHSLLFQAQMEREYTIHTQKKLGLDKLANFVVPNLLSGKQEKIVSAIETELSKQEGIKRQIEAKRNEIDKIIETTLNRDAGETIACRWLKN
jgi:type I restriction enzyme S subunit